ncbi:FAD-dependent oxidoreductase, partial [Pseudonocardia xinjiangensis]|nr:FAD-dependent oxidoreductase [Pseudonocardia xinjiangensis]
MSDTGSSAAFVTHGRQLHTVMATRGQVVVGEHGGGTAMPVTDESVDVVVVGGGNAGFSAAHAAAERGRRVLLLEKGDAATAGGNSYYTAGAVRIAHHGLAEVADLLDD